MARTFDTLPPTEAAWRAAPAAAVLRGLLRTAGCVLAAAVFLAGAGASAQGRTHGGYLVQDAGPEARLAIPDTLPAPGDVFLRFTLPNRRVAPYTNRVNPRDPARKARRVIVAGSGKTVRAFSPFGTSRANAEAYAHVANVYKRLFPALHVYCMPIPTAGAFYTPDAALSWTHPQENTINVIFDALDPGVVPVDVFTPMTGHLGEEVYARTDHHWLPLGAYYAAQAFAALARVPFRPLSDYQPRVVHDFVGTMYGYSRDKRLLSAPEEFVYWVPNTRIKTTYVVYHLDSQRREVLSEDPPAEGEFFRSFPDGSVAAYSTFSGGDARITKVETRVRNGRRLLILKDSFGNALPSFLCFSFEQIHMVDCRYFTENIRAYIIQNKITDLLFANNLSHACTPATVDKYLDYLDQEKPYEIDGIGRFKPNRPDELELIEDL